MEVKNKERDVAKAPVDVALMRRQIGLIGPSISPLFFQQGDAEGVWRLQTFCRVSRAVYMVEGYPVRTDTLKYSNPRE